MRFPLTSIVLLFSLASFGQMDTVQGWLVPDSIKVDSIFHADGRLHEVTFRTLRSQKLTKDEAFSQGLNPWIDTTINYWPISGAEYYQYDKHRHADVIRVSTWGIGNRKGFFVGPNLEIEVEPPFRLNYIGKAGTTHGFSVQLTNTSSKAIRLESQHDTGSVITPFTVELLPNQMQSIPLALTLPEDFHKEQLRIANHSIITSYEITSYGYNISTKEMQKGEQIELDKTFIYYRSGSEPMLKIYAEDGETLVKQVSLAREKTTVDLEELPAGKYWFRTVSFGGDGTLECLVVLK